MNPVIRQLTNHRSIRKFTDQPVPRALLMELIEAGQSAATSSHLQAYSVIRVTRPESRQQLAKLAGEQPYVADCAEFLVFCADMKRPTDAAERAGAEVTRGMTEQLLVATVDTALMAQNVAIAAESEGLGICYIGGIRNNPEAVSELLRLPQYVYPVFGMCLGYPAQNPEIKPRLPVEAILCDDTYDESRQKSLVNEFDSRMHQYYLARTDGKKSTDWSHQLAPLFSSKLRPHMREFLAGQGFEMK